MIDLFRKWLARSGEAEPPETSAGDLQLAVAVLLVEIARADYEHKDAEDAEMSRQLKARFDLSEQDARDLLRTAHERVEDSVSLREFTSRLHSDMSYPEKEAVVEMLWRIALADRDLDKYEDYMIAKIAELLYVYRGDVMRLKQRVIDSMPADGV
jgi:uncharacterized tellurite resistance protein B-like protein